MSLNHSGAFSESTNIYNVILLIKFAINSVSVWSTESSTCNSNYYSDRTELWQYRAKQDCVLVLSPWGGRLGGLAGRKDPNGGLALPELKDSVLHIQRAKTSVSTADLLGFSQGLLNRTNMTPPPPPTETQQSVCVNLCKLLDCFIILE